MSFEVKFKSCQNIFGIEGRIMNGTIALKRAKVVSASFLIMLSVFVLCSCKTAGKEDLIAYARKNFGACEYIRQEHSGIENDEVRTVYLKDKETGIEYSVTSRMNSIDVDGAIFGYTENKTSDFSSKYNDYLIDKAKTEIRDIKSRYGFDHEIKNGTNHLLFNSRVSGNNAEKAAKGFADIMKRYDTKGLFPTEYLVYSEIKVYVGYYDAGTDEWKASGEYEVIDYVHDYYDKGARFSGSLGCFLNQFLDHDEIDRLFPNHDSMPSGTAYYFIGSDGEEFIAIRMEDFGGSAKGIRLFADKAYGMEEIYI